MRRFRFVFERFGVVDATVNGTSHQEEKNSLDKPENGTLEARIPNHASCAQRSVFFPSFANSAGRTAIIAPAARAAPTNSTPVYPNECHLKSLPITSIGNATAGFNAAPDTLPDAPAPTMMQKPIAQLEALQQDRLLALQSD